MDRMLHLQRLTRTETSHDEVLKMAARQTGVDSVSSRRQSAPRPCAETFSFVTDLGRGSMVCFGVTLPTPLIRDSHCCMILTSKRYGAILRTFLGLFQKSVHIDLKIEGFDPQNPGFGPFWAVSERPLLPPKTDLERPSEMCIVPKCGSFGGRWGCSGHSRSLTPV